MGVGRLFGDGWCAGILKKNARPESEYCKHCFNLKQRCFQENEF